MAGAHETECAPQARRDSEIEVGVAVFLERHARPHGLSAIDQRIDAVERRQRLGNGLICESRITDVAHDCDSPGSEGLQFPPRVLGRTGILVDEHDVHAFAGQGVGDTTADSPTSTCDDASLAVECPHYVDGNGPYETEHSGDGL